MADSLRNGVESTGLLGPVVFVIAYALLTVALVPGTIPSLAAGALFGPLWGSLLTVVGATAGALAAFEVARRIGRKRIRRMFGPRVLSADAWVQDKGLGGVIALRLLPVVPFNALNYAFGLSSVRRRDHAVGTAIGIVPGTVAFVALGSSISRPGSTGFLVSVGAVMALFAASAVRSRRLRRRAACDDAAQPVS